MIAANRVLVVGNDAAFTDVVMNYLRPRLPHPPLACRYELFRQYVGPATDGVMILLANQQADAPALKGLLQELMLLQYAPRVIVIENPSADVDDALDSVMSRINERRPWNEGRDLIQSVAALANAGTGLGFFDPRHESLNEKIGRRLVSHTPSLAPLTDQLALAAAHDVTVLLHGETGTGKTFFARLIHECSARSAGRFLVVPCGALAPNLIESELFGHVKGAFTGADAAKVGKFAAVGPGTLLLDEIDVLSPEHQAKLLRVLETGEFEPVGSNDTQTCQGRIIAATNVPLDEAVENGSFRRDLYYRLNVMAFHLPPLRERVHDVEPLIRSLVARFAMKFRKDLIRIHPETIQAMEAFDWPGNIRQLENVIQQAVLLSHGHELLLKNVAPLVQNRCGTIVAPRPSAGTLLQSREAAERASIIRALEGAAYCRTRAAKSLGISRVTLYKKMRAYGLLARPAFAEVSRAAAGA